MKKLKFIFLIVVLVIFNNCASKKSHIKSDIIKEELNDYTSVNTENIGNINTDKILLYVTKENSNGDIWLYNIEKNSKWQITDLNNPNIEIKFIAPNFSFIIFKEDTDYILDLNNEELYEIYLDAISSEKLINIKYVNFINNNSFYCIGIPTTNRNISSIYKVHKTNDRWVAQLIEIPFEFSFLNKTIYNNLVLSPDKDKLAFINNNEFGKLEIYVLNLKKQTIKKLYQLKHSTDIIWGESSSSLYYYEDTSIYNINFKKFTKLILTQDKPIIKLIPYPKQRFKFYYVAKFDDYSFMFLKNTDIIGRGKFLFNNTNIKNIYISASGKSIFWDNSNNEIYYFNLDTLQINKILDNASLLKLNEK